MANTFVLNAEKRVADGFSAREARQSRKVPGVVYGGDFPSTPLSVPYSDFLRVYREAGTSSMIDLQLEGKTLKVLVQSLKKDPLQGTFTHVDFLALNLKKKTSVHVPLIFKGESPAVKHLGGVFVPNHEWLEIRCLPNDIPHDIVIDISSLKEIHDHITVEDLKLDPTKFEVLHLDVHSVVCSVSGRSAKEEEPTTTGPVSAEVPSQKGAVTPEQAAAEKVAKPKEGGKKDK